jgi:hypothetical protein
MLTKIVTLICVLSVSSSSTSDRESQEHFLYESIALVESQSRKYPKGKSVSFDQLDDYRPPFSRYYTGQSESSDSLTEDDSGVLCTRARRCRSLDVEEQRFVCG